MKLLQFILILIIVTPALMHAAFSDQQSADSLCRAGESALVKGDTQEALALFGRAWAAGMSEDSLYYFWSELYTQRGILDTALALNLAARTATDHTLKRNLLKQRYIIYSSLGWADQARAVLDSLGLNRRFVPALSFTLSSGTGSEKRNTGSYPYLLDGRSEHSTNLPGGGIATTLECKIPSGNRIRLTTGIKMLLEQYRFSSQWSSQRDSFEMRAGFFLKADNLWGPMSLVTDLKWSRYHYGAEMVTSSWELAYLFNRPGALHYLRTGIGFDSGDDLEGLPWNAGVNYLLNIPHSSRTSISFFAGALVIRSKSVRYSYSPDYNLFYYDNGFYYSDDTYTTNLGKPESVAALPSRAFTPVLETVIPGNAYSFSAVLSPSFPVFGKLNGSVSFGWSSMIHPEDYEWFRYDTSTFFVNNRNSIVHSRVDGRYYLVTGYDDQNRLVLDTESLDLKEKRLDNVLSLYINLVQPLWRRNELSFTSGFTRRFTTLSRSAPVDLVQVSFLMRLEWTMKLF